MLWRQDGRVRELGQQSDLARARCPLDPGCFSRRSPPPPAARKPAHALPGLSAFSAQQSARLNRPDMIDPLAGIEAGTRASA
jgi:hypothetical protein